MIPKKSLGLPRALASLLAIVGIVFASLVLGVTAASAATVNTTGSVTSGDPSYHQVVPDSFCNQTLGDTTHYDVVAMVVGSDDATTLDITVNPTGFRAAVTIYQGVFLPNLPMGNCFVQPKVGATTGSAVSFSLPLTQAPAGFHTQTYFAVITTDGASSPGGSWSLSASSSNTPINFGDAPPPPPATSTVQSISRSSATPTKAGTLGYDVTFDQAVTGVTASNFKAAVTGSVSHGALSVTGSGANWHVSAGNVSGDGTFQIGFANTSGIDPEPTNSPQGSAYTVDHTAPVVSVPGDRTIEATGSGGASAALTGASATDSLDGAITPTCGPDMSTFPIGETTITCTATDHAGNSGSASYKIIVHDSTKPALHVPDDITLEATGPDGATPTTTLASTATDAVDGSLTPVCDSTTGPFPVGVTTIHCTVTDHAGNESDASYTITVTDKTKPTIDIPDDVTLEATSADGADYTPPTITATDIVDGSLTPDCGPTQSIVPNGDGTITFPIGEATIACTVTDEAGNTATADYKVTVKDTTGPAMDISDDVTLEATSADGADFTEPAATATDAVDGALTPECTPVQTAFPIGDTVIHCTVTDHAGNKTDASYKITVEDTTAPAIDIPSDVTLEATSAAGADFTEPAVTATDAVDGDLTPDCGTVQTAFPIGDTVIHCTITDKAGNKSDASYKITVEDTTAPAIDIPDDATLEATSAAGADFTEPAVTATDAVDGDLTPDCGTPQTTFPIGDTTITCTITDKAGNTTTASYTVTVTDTTAPELTLPKAITVTATDAKGAVVTYEASATDVVSGSVDVTCTPPSGSLFPVGKTVVTCHASDVPVQQPTTPPTDTPSSTPPAIRMAPADFRVLNADDTVVTPAADPGVNEATGTFEVTVKAPPAGTPTGTSTGSASGHGTTSADGTSGGGGSTLSRTGATITGGLLALALGLLAGGFLLMRRTRRH